MNPDRMDTGERDNRGVINTFVSSWSFDSTILAAVYFTLSGLLAVYAGLASTIRQAAQSRGGATPFEHQTQLYSVLLCVVGLAFIRASWLYWSHNKRGVYWALLSIALFVGTWLVGNRPTASDLILGVAALAFVGASHSRLTASNKTR
jgi:hypothetical protein